MKKIIKDILTTNHFPDFMIIGAQKCGTSTLYDLLKNHPQIKGSANKELHYFDSKKYRGFDLEWYKGNFTKLFYEKQLFFEATPNYIYHKEIAKEIASIQPKMKFILILRNPVNRAYSAWNMYRDFFDYNEYITDFKEGLIYKYYFENRTSFPSFKEAIQIELNLIKNKTSKEPALLRRGLYFDQLQEWLTYFNRNQFLILGFKDLKENPTFVLNRVTTFLNLQELNYSDLKINIKNKRSYTSSMNIEDKIFLEEFYALPNKKLASFLGEQINW